MVLSQRLQTAADMVTPGYTVADVGTDHGYIPIYLVKQGIAPSAIAMDLRPGPLAIAEENIRREALEPKISIRISDGVAALQPEDAVETVMITGMGGYLVMHILQEGKELLQNVKELILSPQSELYLVRSFLEQEDYCIAEERMVWEDGKYYVIMRVVHGRMQQQSEIEKRFGAVLLHRRDPLLYSYLCREKKVKQQILQRLKDEQQVVNAHMSSGHGTVEDQKSLGRINSRKSEIQQKLSWIEEALALYE